MSENCHICQGANLVRFPEYETLYQVTSDCKPHRFHGELACCSDCGTVQKLISESFLDHSSRIYSEYCAYELGGGEEQKIFSQNSGMAASRSHLMLETLIREGLIPETGSLLDVGCGNGNLLRTFSTLRPQWTLWGNDLTETSRQAIEAIPNVAGFHCGDVAEIDTRFDLISLLHCLEHIVDPLTFLETLKGKLTPNGALLVEVPSYKANPFDLIVADHAAHYDRDGLERLFLAAGFEIAVCSDSIVPKELTLMAKPKEQARAHSLHASCYRSDVDKALAWLKKMRESALEQSADGGIGVFGTSIAGAWMLSELGDRIAFFVDEDEHRIGKELFGIPVRPPAEIRGLPVLLPFPPGIAKGIMKRLEALGIDFIVPSEI